MRNEAFASKQEIGVVQINTREIVIDCLERIGVIIDGSEKDVNIFEYSIDSISFISFIVDLEGRLSVNLPDEFLHVEILKSLNGFVNLLDNSVIFGNTPENAAVNGSAQ